MEEIIPWSYWVEMIRPYYFANKRGRKPIGIENMLRMYLMQIWFNLSDEGIEDSMYIPFQVNHLHGQTEPVPRRMRATLTETEPVLFDANYQATAC